MKRPSLSLILQLAVILSAIIYRVHCEIAHRASAPAAATPYVQPHHH